MARFSVQDADNYGGQGGTGFFSIPNDRGVKKVRFLYDTIDDVEGLAVHQVEVNGKKRYVNCLREYGQPMDVCPFCANKQFVTAKYFIPVYSFADNAVQIWERGKKFGSKLSSLCSRYPHLVSQAFEIERNGKPGDTQTTYEIYAVGDSDNTTLDDFADDMPNIVGGLVLDKTADEMQYYVDHGCFADSGDNAQPRRREAVADEAPSRRTPSGRGSEDRERF